MMLRGFRSKVFAMAVMVVSALPFGGRISASNPEHCPAACSWSGLGYEEVLDVQVPPVDLVGPLGTEIIDYLHAMNVPVSFIAATGSGPTVKYSMTESSSIRELFSRVLGQAPGYRLDVIGGRIVIFPSEPFYRESVALEQLWEMRRGAAIVWTLREIKARVGDFSRVKLPMLRPLGGAYGEVISVGGARSLVEHLVSLLEGSPSTVFVVREDPSDGEMGFSLRWVSVVSDMDVLAPDTAVVGEAVQLVPILTLASGKSVSLMGCGCSVQFESSDDAVLFGGEGGRFFAVGAGEAAIVVTYQGFYRTVEVRVHGR